MKTSLNTREWVISGYVQGVGFRPFIFRLADQLQLKGWVRNEIGSVKIKATATNQTLNQFSQFILSKSPTIAKPIIDSEEKVPTELFEQFKILESKKKDKPEIHIPPDYFTCPDCANELNDPQNHRYRYPFINCTQCGSRYTLIKALPYDRANTSMQSFTLCKTCNAEYINPLDRRFHAEPVACATCGPHLHYHLNTDLAPAPAHTVSTLSASSTDSNEYVLKASIQALKQGKIIAVKGIGGYHLICDATNSQAVQNLRKRKVRYDKPLAILVSESGDDGLEIAKQYVDISPKEAQKLLSYARPIVLLQKKFNTDLADNIAPNLNEIGIMLPYSPLHYLLLQDFGKPLVATSGNISGEPVITENKEAKQRLNKIADAFLDHNRNIVRPADDSVFKLIAGELRPFRLGRGISPLELELPIELKEAVIAVGGHMKNTVALAWKNRIVISPHIGTLNSPKSLSTFSKTLADLQTLYQVKAKRILCDAHPQYSSTRWAEKFAQQNNIPINKILHHHAHASSCYGEFHHQIDQQCLIFSWDGTGYGHDKTIWGGETFLGQAGTWQRVGSFRPFFLPGGDKATYQPWRSAAALCWETAKNNYIEISPLVYAAWKKKINCPKTSSVGRLFDAAAALLNISDRYSFEGQAPMQLEALAYGGSSDAIELALEKDNQSIWRTDWHTLLDYLLVSHDSVENKAHCFHQSLALALLRQAETFRALHNVNIIGLCGGVFQNKLLSQIVISLLKKQGFDVLFGKQIPVNDAGICYGQVIDYAFQNKN